MTTLSDGHTNSFLADLMGDQTPGDYANYKKPKSEMAKKSTGLTSKDRNRLTAQNIVVGKRLLSAIEAGATVTQIIEAKGRVKKLGTYMDKRAAGVSHVDAMRRPTKVKTDLSTPEGRTAALARLSTGEREAAAEAMNAGVTLEDIFASRRIPGVSPSAYCRARLFGATHDEVVEAFTKEPLSRWKDIYADAREAGSTHAEFVEVVRVAQEDNWYEPLDPKTRSSRGVHDWARDLMYSYAYRKNGVGHSEFLEALRQGLSTSYTKVRGAFSYQECLELHRADVSLFAARLLGVPFEWVKFLATSGIPVGVLDEALGYGVSLYELRQAQVYEWDMAAYLDCRQAGLGHAELIEHANLAGVYWTLRSKTDATHSQAMEAINQKVGNYTDCRQAGLTHAEALLVNSSSLAWRYFLTAAECGVWPDEVLSVQAKTIELGIEQTVSSEEIWQVYEAEIDPREYLWGRTVGCSHDELLSAVGRSRSSYNFSRYVWARYVGATSSELDKVIEATKSHFRACATYAILRRAGVEHLVAIDALTVTGRSYYEESVVKLLSALLRRGDLKQVVTDEVLNVGSNHDDLNKVSSRLMLRFDGFSANDAHEIEAAGLNYWEVKYGTHMGYTIGEMGQLKGHGILGVDHDSRYAPSFQDAFRLTADQFSIGAFVAARSGGATVDEYFEVQGNQMIYALLRQLGLDHNAALAQGTSLDGLRMPACFPPLDFKTIDCQVDQSVQDFINALQLNGDEFVKEWFNRVQDQSLIRFGKFSDDSKHTALIGMGGLALGKFNADELEYWIFETINQSVESYCSPVEQLLVTHVELVVLVFSAIATYRELFPRRFKRLTKMKSPRVIE